MKRELLYEYRSGQRALNHLKNVIATDIMKVIRGNVNTSVPAYIVSDAEMEEYLSDEEIVAEPVAGYSLEGYSWDLKIDTDKVELEDDEEEFETDIDVSFFLIRSPKIKGFNISGYNSTYENLEGIHVQLEIDESLEVEQALGKIRTELGNTIRHELEHLTQKARPAFARDEKYYSLETPWKPETEYAKEIFLTPEEVSAHVRGYADTAKSLDDLEKELRQDLKNYVNSEKITAKDRDLIVMVYLDWARRHLKSKKFTS